MGTEHTEEQIQEHVAAGNFHAAINIAISGVNECRRNEDQAGTDNFIVIIKGIVHKLTQEFGSKELIEKNK